MKSYKHLFDICISEENRRRAIQKAKRTKRIRKMIRKRHLSDEAMLALSYFIGTGRCFASPSC